jgi:hypothetical protein
VNIRRQTKQIELQITEISKGREGKGQPSHTVFVLLPLVHGFSDQQLVVAELFSAVDRSIIQPNELTPDVG